MVPFAAKKSSIVLISFPVDAMLYAIPATPVAHGTLYMRSGSNPGCCSAGRRFFWFGNSAASSFWTHLSWLIKRFAIQSVSTKPSRPMLLPRLRFGRILAKYSLLSLMSSV